METTPPRRKFRSHLGQENHSRSAIYCLTVRQPFAWAIIHGNKLIENRSWPTNYRGPLVIHSATTRKFGSTWPVEKHPPFDTLDYRAFIGVVDLIDCVQRSPLAARDITEQQRTLWYDRAAIGPWCWILRNARSFDEPLEWPGQQGLFPMPDHLLATLKELMSESA